MKAFQHRLSFLVRQQNVMLHTQHHWQHHLKRTQWACSMNRCAFLPHRLTEPCPPKVHPLCCRFTEGAAKAKEVAADASKQDAGPSQASAAGSNGTKETLKKTS